ncbi:MAG: flagellar basal body P-ring protein FlgI [Rhodospirillaceae bacterium]|nr:flagellar basal body P-ring protein FlgI [Rhodospirillaceae bacterium]
MFATQFAPLRCAHTTPLRFAPIIDRLWFVAVHALMFVLLLAASSAHASSRVKDLAGFEGVRENMLVGYGLVTGLQGTGDDLKKIGATKNSLLGMLERLGINSRDDVLQTDNVAAVMVTATLPPFARQGSKVDITVSSLGNAKSLSGGTLAVTPLMGADGEVYAAAQGEVQIGGFSAQGQGASVSRGVPTSGRIPNGAIVEREIDDVKFANMDSMKIALHNPDLTTARRVSDAVNAFLGTTASVASDPGTVLVHLPEGYKGTMVNLMTDIEQLRVEPDSPAKVIVDERTGIVVIGDQVRISTVAIAQGNLTIKVTETPQVSQPAPFSETGTTTVVPRTDIQVDEGSDKRLAVVNGGVNLQELVNGLNALGIGPRDMISILQAIKAAGALQADIEVM